MRVGLEVIPAEIIEVTAAHAAIAETADAAVIAVSCEVIYNRGILDLTIGIPLPFDITKSGIKSV